MRSKSTTEKPKRAEYPLDTSSVIGLPVHTSFMSKTTETGLNKPIRKFERINAISMKPIQFVPGDTEEDDKCSICFVDGGNKEVLLPCTVGVARRVEGPRTNPKKSGLSGLDAKLDTNFFVLVDNKPEGRVAVGVDSYPKNEPRKFVKSDNDGDSITLQINQISGDIDILSMPMGLAQAQVRRIAAKLDEKKAINIGDEIVSGYVVTGISGNRVTLDLQ